MRTSIVKLPVDQYQDATPGSNPEEIRAKQQRDSELLHRAQRWYDFWIAALVIYAVFWGAAIYVNTTKANGLQLVKFTAPLTPSKDTIDHFEICENHRFETAKIEWFIALGWAFGVVGALWAVWAKLKADQAFLEAENAARESFKAFTAATDAVTHSTNAANQSLAAANQSLAAFGEAKNAAKHAERAFAAASTRSVEFPTLVETHLWENVKETKSTLHLLLGIPQVGYFFRDRNEFPFAGTAHDEGRSSKLFDNILTKAMELLGDTEITGEVKLVFFDNGLCHAINNQVADKKAMSKESTKAFANSLAKLHERIEALAARVHPRPLLYERYGPTERTQPFDPGIRIVVFDQKNIARRKAIFWFVSDFVDDSPTEFGARAMETEDQKLVDLLDNLILYYFKRAQTQPTSVLPLPSAPPPVSGSGPIGTPSAGASPAAPTPASPEVPVTPLVETKPIDSQAKPADVQ